MPEHALRLKVLTFNTGNDFPAPSSLIGFLEQSDAGIVGLQELSPRNAAALEPALLRTYPYRVLRGEIIHGKGLLSRYPITRHQHFVLASGRPYLEAEVVVNDRRITVVVAHPPPADIRKLEVVSARATMDLSQLLGRLSLERPTLLLGDFNITALGRMYRMLRRAGLVDIFRVAGEGRSATYPTRYPSSPVRLTPVVRIDYIWASEHFLPVSSYVGPDCGSDHLPLLAQLALP